MIDNSRLQVYRAGPPVPGHYVLYWMQQAQRTRFNHALEWAVATANACRLPLVVAVAVADAFPGANARHYTFMLQGLADVAAALQERGIAFTVRRGDPPAVIASLAAGAALLVGDVGYLRLQRQWREAVAACIRCPFTAVETDVIVPVGQASGKEEYAARTLRPKIHRLLDRYLVPVLPVSPLMPVPAAFATPASIPAPSRLPLDRSVPPSPVFTGGQRAAEALLGRFIAEMLPRYHTDRNDPSGGLCSNMSPYLHFGQISPLEIALRVRAAGVQPEAAESFLEELIVRRELSMNLVQYNPGYDTYAALPGWARLTLDKHRHDPREALYSRAQFEQARTHDPYWNAAQREMLLAGKMHNYMRMYWGKKVIAWSATPEEAFETLLYLNNRYELDGRDANGFTGVAWCFGKHDRPWGERPVFGTVRYMAASGLERKFNMADYVRKVGEL